MLLNTRSNHQYNTNSMQTTMRKKKGLFNIFFSLEFPVSPIWKKTVIFQTNSSYKASGNIKITSTSCAARGSPSDCWVSHYLLGVQWSPSEEHCNISEGIIRPKQRMSHEGKRETCVHDKKLICGEELHEWNNFCGKSMNCLVVRT